MDRLLFFFISLFLISCNALTGSSSLRYSLIPVATLDREHIPNKSYFFVQLKGSFFAGAESDYDPLDALMYAMDEGLGTDCKISSTKESTEDLYCMLDVMEGDLYMHEIVLEYNTPPEMCEYTAFEIPWHYNQKVGDGPSKVYKCEIATVTGSGTNKETKTQYCKNLTDRGCTVCEDEVENLCPYIPKKTASQGEESDLANCCMGEYKEIEVKDGTPSPPSDTPTDWGGNLKECMGGIGRVADWPERDKDGKPIRIITPTLKSGLNEDFKIPPIYEVVDKADHIPSYVTATYFKDVEDKALIKKDGRPDKKKWPYIYQKPDNYSKGEYNLPYITWSCLDKAFEVRHRIHLVIREFNTQEEFTKFKEEGRGDPDIPGKEGGEEDDDCKYYEPGEYIEDTDCNDLLDLDDWNKKNPPEYPNIEYK